MLSSRQLYQRLLDLDQRSYKAYKAIQGQYTFPEFTLSIDHVQGDPFAAPSRMRVMIPQTHAQFPPALYATASRDMALRDYLNRQFDRLARTLSSQRGSGKSGLIAIARPGQQVLERTAIGMTAQQVEARFVVGLPARGRTILGRQAAELLCEELPQLVERSLYYSSLDAEAVQQQVETVEDADWLRGQLAERGLVAFVPDGAVLPRRSGVDDRPLIHPIDSQDQQERSAQPDATQHPIAFRSPPSLRVEFDRPNCGKITGMGIPQGITLIVGGGYHGKSTLLQAIALGVYNHIPGDGREQVVTQPTAVKIRAEDGRSVTNVNISPFITHLPQGRSTRSFSTANASGSTSQAANIIEALEAGATLLLLDEDTSATNFMIRDRRMQALIGKAQEPITPFLDKIRQLYEEYGVSTVLVMGGSGDYFDVADTVIAMTEFVPQDVTAQAQTVAQTYATHRQPEGGDRFGDLTPRVLRSTRAATASDRHWNRPARRQSSDRLQDEREADPPKLKVRDVDQLVIGPEAVDLTGVEQIVETGQLRAIGLAIHYMQQRYLDADAPPPLAALIRQVMLDATAGGLDVLTPDPQGDLVQFRALELAATINRLRSIVVHSSADG